jgi:hypothetical protein
MSSCHTMALWAEEGAGLQPELQADDVLSAERSYLIDAFEHIDSKYGGVSGYLETCGLDKQLQSRVRANLLQDAGAAAPDAVQGA